jgi:hypothetical protein
MENRHIVNGEPVKMKKNVEYTEICCDCDLTHRRRYSKDVTIISWRDDYTTKKLRKRRRK